MRQVDFAKADFGQEEKDAVNKVMEGYWLASGEENISFEKEFAEYIGTKEAVCVSSGSMANLIALKALNIPIGSKVLTSACGFPATAAPILHLGLEPVFVDYDLETHNIDLKELVNKMFGIKAVLFAHTMGNPVDIEKIKFCADMLGIHIIEDCCEAVGTSIHGKKVGSIGIAGTYSFYPAHQMTALGGGGMITVNDENLAKEMRSLRDWGKVWDWDTKLGNNVTSFEQSKYLDFPYYKGYTYQTIGFNAKLPEANAAFGRVQLKKLDSFVKKRIDNYYYLQNLMKDRPEFFKIKEVDGSVSAWFGYIFTFKYDGFRDNLVTYLESNGVRTRPFFAGNITKHKPYKIYESSFKVADHLMKNSFFVGVHQLLNKEDLDYIAQKVKKWLDQNYPSQFLTTTVSNSLEDVWIQYSSNP